MDDCCWLSTAYYGPALKIYSILYHKSSVEMSQPQNLWAQATVAIYNTLTRRGSINFKHEWPYENIPSENKERANHVQDEYCQDHANS